MEVIFATKNKDKLKEIQEILIDFDVLSMTDAGFDIDVIEDGETFSDNAIKKAVEIMEKCNKIVLADDSGLEIDFLDKAPGVHSARYLGRDTPYDIKNKKILELLEGVPKDKRTARFVSVIACALPSGKVFTTTGIISGIIADEIKGHNGFGYDPIFYVPDIKKTTAELSIEEKNVISHRGKALRQMKDLLTKHLEDLN